MITVPVVRPHLLATPHTGIRRMLDMAANYDNPLMLISGDPNFGTPAHITKAAAELSYAGKTGYAPAVGLLSLREAIAEKVWARNGIATTAQGVCVTTGACGGLFSSLMLMAGPGDEVLVPDPGWSNYAAMLHVLGVECVQYPAALDGRFLDPDDLAARITPRTKAILINSPSNPSGRMADQRDITALISLADEHDLWLLSDEAYDEITFDVPAISPAALGDKDRVVTVFSFSKTYAMTGWRLGYVVGPQDFITQLSLHQEPLVSSASTIAQHAACAALSGDQSCVTEMVTAYRRRSDAARAVLDEAGIGYVRPEGAFFLMIRLPRELEDSWEFARRLLTERGVGIVPGLAFGARGEGYVRVSLAASDENVTEGVRRIADFIRQVTHKAHA